MKKILLILCILCFPVFCLGQGGWVDTGGSTWTTTASGVEKEIKDIQNDVLDRGIDSWQVTITSGLQFLFVLVSTNTEAELAEMVKLYVLTSSGTDTVITRLDTIDTELIKHYVLISSGGDTTITRLDTINTELIKHYVLSSSNTATIMAELIKEYVLMSSGADTTITRLDTINTELIKHYVLISSGGDTTITRLDTLNTELIKHYVLSSSNTATVLAELIAEYVLMSSGADTTITRLDTINTELIKHYVLISSGADTTITRLDTINTELIKGYVLISTGTDLINTTLDSIDGKITTCDTDDVTAEKLRVDNSTGTVLSVGAGASVSYTPQSTVVELFIDSIDDNTDTVRMRFYDENVITAGSPIYVGTGKIIDTWKNPIYFQAESGTQLIIVNEVYE